MDPNDELSVGFICVDKIRGSKDRKIRDQNAPCHHCIVDHDLGYQKIHLQTVEDQNHSLMVGDHKRIDMTDLILFESKEYSPVIHSRELILKYMFKNCYFYWKSQFEFAFPKVVVFIMPQVKFGRNGHSEDALHFPRTWMIWLCDQSMFV